MRCARNSRPRALRSRRVRGVTGSWWSMILTAISSSSTIRAKPRRARLLKTKPSCPAAPWRDGNLLQVTCKKPEQKATRAVLELASGNLDGGRIYSLSSRQFFAGEEMNRFANPHERSRRTGRDGQIAGYVDPSHLTVPAGNPKSFLVPSVGHHFRLRQCAGDEIDNICGHPRIP